MNTFNSFDELPGVEQIPHTATSNMSPKIDSYAGYDFFVLSDDHAPPHVHIFKGNSDLGKLSINPEDTTQDNTAHIPAGDLRKLKKQIKKQSEHYLHEWNKHHPGDETHAPK